MVTPVVAFIATLLTTRDGQGEVSMGGALRVIILSGAAEGQEVPQGARTVERDYPSVNPCPENPRKREGEPKSTYLRVCANSREGESNGEELHDARESLGSQTFELLWW